MRSSFFIILSVVIHSLCVAALVLSPMRMAEQAGGDDVEVTMGDAAAEAGQPDRVGETEAPAEAQAPVEPVKAPPIQPLPVKVKPAKPLQAKVQAPKPVPVPEVAETSPEVTESEVPENLDPQIEESPEAAPQEVTSVVTTEGENTDTDSAEPLGKGGATEAGAVKYTDLKMSQGNQPPVYPLEARRQHRQGEVELLYEIMPDGSVTNIKIARSSGHEDLDKAAMNAIAKYKFIAGQEGWAKHPVIFALKGQPDTLPSRLRTMDAQSE